MKKQIPKIDRGYRMRLFVYINLWALKIDRGYRMKLFVYNSYKPMSPKNVLTPSHFVLFYLDKTSFPFPFLAESIKFFMQTMST